MECCRCTMLGGTRLVGRQEHAWVACPHCRLQRLPTDGDASLVLNQARFPRFHRLAVAFGVAAQHHQANARWRHRGDFGLVGCLSRLVCFLGYGAAADRSVQTPASGRVASALQRSTKRKNTPNQGFQPNTRYTNCRPVFTIWHGNRIIAFKNVLNSIRSTRRFSSRCCSLRRPSPVGSGKVSAHQAFRFQASDVMTM